MKNTLLAAAFLVICYTATAQTVKTAPKPKAATPEAVEASFKKAYPTVKHVDFDKEGNNYEAEFKLDGKAMSTLYDAEGNLKETETTMPMSSLPAPVKEYLSKNYPGVVAKETSKIVDAAGVVTYEAEVKGKDLIFDQSGAYLRTVKE